MSPSMCKQLELMANVDVILGTSWIETLGEVKVNWRTLCMLFKQNGKKVKFQRDSSLCKSQFLLKSLFKENEVEILGMVLLKMKETQLEQKTCNQRFLDQKRGC
ncbi:hypothetical protein CR513_01905, partial [Mucuna pruriens]